MSENAEVEAVLDAWIAQLALALDVDPAVVPRALVLDVARDAAHHVARPAAPLTTFLVGYAAGRASAVDEAPGAADEAIAQAAEVARALAVNR